MQYCTGALPQPSKWPAKLVHYFLVILIAVALAATGEYGGSSCPMAVSSGFRSSPGHAALGNTICIAPAHRRGHQNGRRMRYICSSLPNFSLTLFVAKDHVMVNQN